MLKSAKSCQFTKFSTSDRHDSLKSSELLLEMAHATKSFPPAVVTFPKQAPGFCGSDQKVWFRHEFVVPTMPPKYDPNVGGLVIAAIFEFYLKIKCQMIA